MKDKLSPSKTTKHTIMNKTEFKCPDILSFMSVDEVAECVEVDGDTYTELWRCLERADQAGTAKPPGGDGSDGTTEEPIISSGEYGSDLVSAWPSLSDQAKRSIIKGALSYNA